MSDPIRTPRLVSKKDLELEKLNEAKEQESNSNNTVNKEELKEVISDLNKRDEVPTGYLPFKVSTNGQLYCPKLLHIRNFIGQELTDLSILDDESSIEATARTLKDLIHEDTDPLDYNQEEVIEILVFIAKSFWDKKVHLPYPLSEEDEEFLKDNKDFALLDRYRKKPPIVDISIDSLETYKIPDDLKMPVRIETKDKSESVTFRVVTLRDIIIGKDYLDKVMFEEEKLIQPLIKKYDKDSTQCTIEEINEITEYQQKKLKLLYSILKSLCLVKYNDKDLETIEDKLDAVKSLGSTLTKKMNDIVDKIPFGYKKEILVKSPITKEETLRSYSFRFLSILENLQLPDDDEFNISFG